MAASRKAFSPFALDNLWRIEFPTDPPGVLRLDPGQITLAARFIERERNEEGWGATVDCELRLADAEGRLWHATWSFSSDRLLYPLIDLSRPEPARWVRNAPPEWKKALKRPLLKGTPATYDDRFHRYIWVDNTFVFLRFKYLAAEFAVAALSATTLLVRVGGLFCSWNAVRVAGPDGAPLPPGPRLTPEEREEQEEEDQESDASGDHDDLPPLVYPIEAGRLLFPRPGVPLVFTRHKGQAEPQRIVTSHPGTRPRAARIEGEDAGFIDLPFHYRGKPEFLTDAGGRLAVEGEEEKLALAFRLERHPDGAALPFDVLRGRVRLTDAVGDVWEAVTHFTPDVFFEKLVDTNRTNGPAFATEPPGSEALLSGVRARLDGEGWRYVLLYVDCLIAFPADGQEVLLDVHPPDEYGEFPVTLSGLVGRRRPIELDVESEYLVLDPEARAAEVAGWERDGPLPAIQFRLLSEDLLFRNTTFAVDDGFWHHSPVPIPVVFTRVGQAEPNAAVRFVADA